MGLNIKLLEDSFELLAPQGDALVERFYDNLFNDYPVVRPLFENVEMQEQRSKLLAGLALVVANLRSPDQLVPALEEMGQRHVEYGAVEDYYPAVGATLLKSLAEIAGDAWNDELEQAWSDAYGEISKIMLAGVAAVTI
ncbi:MAG: flavohemoprotein [Blastopirellula sp.]|nr:MAG: flavohemoprotein [Blastopirellula sp.]